MTNNNTQFNSILDVIEFFTDQATCKAFLEKMRWGNNITCPHCKHENAYRTKVGYKCSSNKCYKKFSVITKTIFEGTKIPLRKWFVAIFLLINNNPGISSVSLSKQIKITQKSAWFLLHRLREVMKKASTNKLSGIIEADETIYGGKESNKPKSKRSPKNRGKGLVGTKKIYIIGAVEQGGNVATIVSDNSSREVLIPFLNENIEKESTIVTDAYPAYNVLPEHGYKHISNKHSKYKFVRVVDGVKYHTQTIEGFWSLFKCSTLGTHRHISQKHLNKYTAEHTHKYNIRKKKPSERFRDVLGLFENARLKYESLIQKK